MNTAAVEQAAKLLHAARSICVSTGAGMSAESGIETFRDPDGLWSRFDPEQLATPMAFARNPQNVWAWYRERRARLAQVEPHAGHLALAAWERRCPGFTIVTQNIDGLHHRAGSRRVIELHGRLDVARCTACPQQVLSLEDLGPDPRCTACGARLRPGVVWFYEPLPAAALAAAETVIQDCDVMLLIGTSGVVEPAASLPRAARQSGARLIEVNPEITPHSRLCEVCLRTGCRDALLAIETAWLTIGR